LAVSIGINLSFSPKKNVVGGMPLYKLCKGEKFLYSSPILLKPYPEGPLSITGL
jgi:hypothetical protein